MMKPRILEYNYAFDDSVEISVSSENPAFPVSNLRNPNRSFVYRSSGYFKITATNKRLNFKDAALGSELTAVLTEGEYTPTTLATEIKMRMQAVGANTYTVTFSSLTGKWTISTSGSYLSLLRSTGSNVGTSVWTTIGFTTSADSTGATSYTGAKVAIHSYERIIFDLKSAEEVDSFVMKFNPMRSDIPFTDAAVFRLQANATDDWTSPAVDILLTLDRVYKAISHFFASPQEYRFFAVYICDPENPELYIEVPLIFFGKATTLSRNPDKGFSFKKIDMSKTEENEYGHAYSDLRPFRGAMTIDYNVLVESDLAELERIFEDVGTVIPIVFVLDPEGAVFEKNRFLIYGRLQGAFDAKQVHYRHFTAGYDLLEAM